MESSALRDLQVFDSRPVDRDDFAVIEKLVGYPLGDELREFLVRSSGGTPARTEFHYGNPPSGASIIQYFYAVSGSPRDIDLLTNAITQLRGRIPRAALPLAEDPGGNVVLIYLDGARQGEVWYWDHDQEGDPAAQDANLHFIAKNLPGFLDSLDD